MIRSTNRVYRYYARRPLGPGTIPDTKVYPPAEVKNFDMREDVSAGAGPMAAWGYVAYPLALPEEQAENFELEPARDNEDILSRLAQLAAVLGPIEDEHNIPTLRRFTAYDQAAGCYLVLPGVALKKLEERVALVK